MKRKYLSLLVASLFAAPLALAQQADPFRVSGSIGVGGIATDDDVPDAAKLHEYRDLSDGLLTTIDIKGRNSRWWLDLFGENFGRDDQYINLRGGMYDVFKYRLYSDALKHNFMFFGITPYSGAGTATQRTTFPRLNASTWEPLELGYKRRDDGVMFEYQRASPWYARVDANQVTWSGSKAGAASQGTSPGNGFVELALPVNYTTRNAMVEGGYNTRTMRFDLSWTASKFENDNDRVTWTNGYFGNGIDTTYLAADNRYQRLMGNAVFRSLPWATTLAARFTMDELKSGVNLGTSVLNGTAGQITQTNPNMAVFDGKVTNNTFTVSASSMPTRGLDTKVYYNYRKRDDESPEVTFTAPAATVREGMSYEKNNWGFDAYYRLDRANRLGVGYDYLDTDREGRHEGNPARRRPRAVAVDSEERAVMGVLVTLQEGKDHLRLTTPAGDAGDPDLQLKLDAAEAIIVDYLKVADPTVFTADRIVQQAILLQPSFHAAQISTQSPAAPSPPGYQSAYQSVGRFQRVGIQTNRDPYLCKDGDRWLLYATFGDRRDAFQGTQ